MSENARTVMPENKVPGQVESTARRLRDCSGLAEHLPAGVTFHCYSIKDKLPYCYDAADLTCNMLVLSLRGYIRPETQRATDKNSVLNSKYILLTRPTP
jgi:hypothetical protein